MQNISQIKRATSLPILEIDIKHEENLSETSINPIWNHLKQKFEEIKQENNDVLNMTIKDAKSNPYGDFDSYYKKLLENGSQSNAQSVHQIVVGFCDAHINLEDTIEKTTIKDSANINICDLKQHKLKVISEQVFLNEILQLIKKDSFVPKSESIAFIIRNLLAALRGTENAPHILLPLINHTNKSLYDSTSYISYLVGSEYLNFGSISYEKLSLVNEVLFDEFYLMVEAINLSQNQEIIQTICPKSDQSLVNQPIDLAVPKLQRELPIISSPLTNFIVKTIGFKILSTLGAGASIVVPSIVLYTIFFGSKSDATIISSIFTDSNSNAIKPYNYHEILNGVDIKKLEYGGTLGASAILGYYLRSILIRVIK